MKAIFIKILPMTNHLPTRLKAYDMDNNKIVLSGEHSKENYIHIVKQFIKEHYGLRTDPNMSMNSLDLDYDSFTHVKRVLVSGGMKQGSVWLVQEQKA